MYRIARRDSSRQLRVHESGREGTHELVFGAHLVHELRAKGEREMHEERRVGGLCGCRLGRTQEVLLSRQQVLEPERISHISKITQ